MDKLEEYSFITTVLRHFACKASSTSSTVVGLFKGRVMGACVFLCGLEHVQNSLAAPACPASIVLPECRLESGQVQHVAFNVQNRLHTCILANVDLSSVVSELAQRSLLRSDHNKLNTCDQP